MTGEVQFEPSAVGKRGTENPYQKSHIELMNTFNPLVTDPAAESKADYAKIADGWERDMQIFAARIKRSSESAWTGTAATAARQSISDYANDALNLTPALQALSSGVGQAVDAVLTTRKNMPEYADADSWWNPWDWPDDDLEGKAEAAAQRVVLESYVNPMVETDGKVPVLPTPKDPVTSNGPAGNGDGNGDGGSNGGNPTTQTPQTATPETTPESTTPETEDPSDDTASPDSETEDDNTEGSETPDTAPQSATPESTVPQSATPQTPTSGTPSGGGGSAGAGSGGGAGAGAGAGVPGAAVPGSPAAATRAGTGSGGAGTGAAGRNGMGGMGGMGPGGARGGNNDEDEHTTPDYLVYDRESELLGTQPPALPPGGVIGA